MARYSMNAELGGSVSPINWDTKEFNLGIVYSGGFITIDDPGYYRVQTSCYNDSRDSGAECPFMINGKTILKSYTRYSATSTSYGIFYLNLFDTVYVAKGWSSQKLKWGTTANYFTIEKL